MWQKIVLVAGIILLLLSALAVIIWTVVVVGEMAHVNEEEAAMGFGVTGCCCFLSVVVFVVGLVAFLMNRKKLKADGNAPQI